MPSFLRRGEGLIAIGMIECPHDRAAADAHRSSEPIEGLPRLPATVHFEGNPLVRRFRWAENPVPRHDTLAGRSGFLHRNSVAATRRDFLSVEPSAVLCTAG